MIKKTSEKGKAIALRKQGLSYNEILKKIPVAKSSLSLWLREVGLATVQKQRITQKKLAAALRGSLKRKQQRIEIDKQIRQIAINEIKKVSDYELLLIGATLYWAEGAKQKEHLPSTGILFSNSDLSMIKVFLSFLRVICKIPENEIYFEIYIHKSADHKTAQQWWSNELSINITRLQKVYFKKNHIKKSYRKNTGDDYHGQLRIKVRNSANLNRKISGWADGIVKKIV